MTDTQDVESSAIQGWVTGVLVASGLTETDAQPVAESLIFAELRGVATHGLLRLTTYVDRIRAGGISRDAQVGPIADLGALVVLDADHAPGAASGVIAADLAVERAMNLGIGCVIVRNANHFGASAFFTNRIADAGLLGLAMCNTEPVMCAPFGGRPVLGTNPLALAVPVPHDVRPQVDMATTTVSQGRLIMARQAGESIPLGWAVDADGRPTTSAADGLLGALLPAGGPKGFGLAFAVDALLALGGAHVSPGVAALHGDHSAHQRAGHLFLAIRADAAAPSSQYVEQIHHLVEAIHHSGIGSDGAAPMMPGEPELNRVRQAAGLVRLSDSLLTALRPLEQQSGLPLPVGSTPTSADSSASYH